MSSVTSGHRLPPRNPIDLDDAPDISWTRAVVYAVVIVAVLYVTAFLMAVL